MSDMINNALESELKATESKPKVKTKTPAEIAKERRDAKAKANNRLIKGKFIFHESRNGSITLNFSKGGPVKAYTLKDGQVEDIPMSLARHLNNSGKTPVHRWQTDDKGKPVRAISEYTERYSFIPVANLETDFNF